MTKPETVVISIYVLFLGVSLRPLSGALLFCFNFDFTMTHPYPKQGERIDGVDAYWIAYPFIALTLDIFTAAASQYGDLYNKLLVDGREVISIAAQPLSEDLKMSVNELIAANKSKKLMLANKVLPPAHGALSTMAIRFSVGDKKCVWELDNIGDLFRPNPN